MLLHEEIQKDNWLKNDYVQTVYGEKTSSRSSWAARWCLMGHIDKHGDPFLKRWRIYRDLSRTIKVLYPERVPKFLGFTGWPSPVIAFRFNDHFLTTLDDIQRVCKVSGH